MMGNTKLSLWTLATGAAVLFASKTEAIPTFARKPDVGCGMCHTSYSQLNRFARDYRDNGFRLPEEVDQPRFEYQIRQSRAEDRAISQLHVSF